MKTHNVVINAVLAAAISAILSTTAVADNHAKGELLKVQPVAVYHAARGSSLAETLTQVAQRTGITFKINTDLSQDLIQQSIAADNWNTAVKTLLAGYNYSTVAENGNLKTVIIIGRLNQTGSTAEKSTAASIVDDVIVIETKMKPLPQKYKDFPVGSVTPIVLPIEKMMAVENESSIVLDLPMGQFNVTHENTVNEVDSSKTWVGFLKDEGEGYRVYLSQGTAGTMGMMTTPDGTYNIETSNEGIYLIDTAKLQHAGFEGDQIAPSEAMLNQIAINAEMMDVTQAQIDQLQAVVDTAKMTLDAANADVAKYTDLLAKHTAQLNASTNSASALAAAVKAKDTASKVLTDATSVKNSAVNALNQATSAKNQAMTNLAAASTAKNAAQITYDAKNTAIKSAKTALDNAIGVKTKTLAELNSQLAILNTANIKLQSDQNANSAAYSLVMTASAAKSKAQSTASLALSSVNQAKNALTAAQTAQNTANTKLSAAKTVSDKATAKTAVDKANTAFNNAKAKYDAAVTALNTANAALAIATTNYNTAFAKAETANAAFQTSRNAFKSAYDGYNNTLNANNAAVITANIANNSYSIATQSFLEAQKALANANASLSIATVANNSAVTAFNSATAALNSAMTNFKNATTALTTAIANYDAALANSKIDVSALQASVNSTKTTLDQKTAAAKVAKTNYDQAVTALNAAKAGGVDSGNNSGGSGTSTGPVVDLMMLYTTVNQTADYAKQRIALLTTATNQAYKDSGINMTLRVVYTESTAYSESVSNSQALDDLANDRNLFAGVSAKRVQYGADLVFLFRPLYAQTHGSCGTTYLEFANGNPANKWLGYGTIGDGSSKDAMTGYYCAMNTYTHEIGHSLGLVHDREYSNASGVFNYSYAWGNQGSFGTIMSYKQPVVMYFSAPALTTQCKGQACGYPETDSARSSDQAKSVNYTAPIVANFMPTAIASPISK
jgi:hypothetical protein